MNDKNFIEELKHKRNEYGVSLIKNQKDRCGHKADGGLLLCRENCCLLPLHSVDFRKKLSRPWYSLVTISNISSGVSWQPFCSQSLMILVSPLLKNSI